jgi:hypothetical protein
MHTKAYPLAFHDPKVPICSFPDQVYRTLDARAFFHFWQLCVSGTSLVTSSRKASYFLARPEARGDLPEILESAN